MSVPASTEKSDDLRHPSLYFNRELSWLRFNERVLAAAVDHRRPLLERVKFVSIFASNLDEFFMIRVSGLRQQLQAGVVQSPADGMTPSEQLAAIRRELLPALGQHAQVWRDLLPELADNDVRLLSYGDLKKKQKRLIGRYFRDEVFPTLTPLANDPVHPFPHVSNLSLNLAILVSEPEGPQHFARLKLPGFFPRLLPVAREDDADEAIGLGLASEHGTGTDFVWMEDIVAANLEMLFPGMVIDAAYPFRVTRDADQEIEQDEAGDLLTNIEANLRLRDFGSVVRLEITDAAPPMVRELLVQNLGLAPYQVYTVTDRVGMADVAELASLDRPELKDAPYDPGIPESLQSDDGVFAAIRRRDILLYHPYDSFAPVVDFIRQAAEDPDVLAIKQTLYRIGADSPIVQSLVKARENGKQVAALVELKARFDEANNIVWARALEDAGVHVVYGVLGLKTHAKMCLVVRREEHGIAHYLHAGTGNYNASTARAYTDLGLFTADRALGAEAARLFNALTGYAREPRYERLLVAPGNMREGVLRRIDREIARQSSHGDGYLAFKMNSLVDPACIRALYRASQAGVRVRLQIRGICCLRPGVAGISENIEVVSLVGRFLEHARVFYFRNGGDDEILIGSADLMPRNLDARVELLFPVTDERLRAAIRERILALHFDDTVNAHRLTDDGTYVSLTKQEPAFDSQAAMIESRGSWSD